MKDKNEEVFQIKEDWKDMKNKCNIELDQILKQKNKIKDNWQILNLDYGLDDSILSMLNFSIFDNCAAII